MNSDSTEGVVTRLLSSARDGAPDAMARICELLYSDLRVIARSRLRGHGRQTMLNTTALVHESFLRLVNAGELAARDRVRFLAYATRVMHSVIVDEIRNRKAERRGGDMLRVTFDTSIQGISASEDEVLLLSETITHLRTIDENAMCVAEMRYFAGMDEGEIAEAMGTSERTVRRNWKKAKVLLNTALTERHAPD